MTTSTLYPDINPSLLLDFANLKKLDPRITFSRASEGRYYDGKTTAKAEENLLLNSQNITASGWGLTNITATADTTTAPDGTLTADSMFGTNVTNFNSLNAAFAGFLPGETYAVSVFVKKGTMRYISIGLYINTSNNCGAGFDLDTNTVTGTGSIGSGYSASGAAIVDVGGGWYRCSVICVVGTTVPTGFRIFHRTSAYTTGAIGETITASTSDETYIWGAQLEQRSAATAYTVTTTQPITNYVPQLLTAASGVARFDHDPVTCESLGLLIEEQRTNLILQSEDFDTTWAETRATLNLNSYVSPAGTLTADALIASTDNDTHFTSQTFTGTAVAHTFSVYAKAAGYSHVALRLFNGTSEVGLAYYNLSTGATGTVSSGTAAIQSVGNGWYRCSLTATLAASASCTANIYVASADNTNSFAGDAFDGVAVWGAQLEAGAFPTSYIPTTASQVTRSADEASMTGTNFSSWYRQDEGTMYVKSSVPAFSLSSTVTYAQFFVSNATSNDLMRVRAFSTSGTLRFDSTGRVASVTQFDTGQYDALAGQTVAQALAYRVNDIADSKNGGSVDTDSSALIPVVDRAGFGLANAHLRKLAYYPKRLTNAQLQALTR